MPEARRFVTERVLALGCPELSDDAALCVSELATNAAIHGSGPLMEVALEPAGAGIRITVEDAGRLPRQAVAPRHDYGTAEHEAAVVEDPLTSGRGLAIVAYLAHAWGVETTAGGTRVWAELLPAT